MKELKTEMTKLIKMLTDAEIPFEVIPQADFDGAPQVWYPSLEAPICDVICHKWSYGGKDGLLEIMGLVSDDCGDDVEGYLTADEVFKRISEDYKAS